MTSQKITFTFHFLSDARHFGAGVVLNDNCLWVTGGILHLENNVQNIVQLKSTEFITFDGAIYGPNMQRALHGHCVVVINSTFSMIIGGYTENPEDSTFYFDHDKYEWINGQSLIQARYYHAAGIIIDEVTGEDFVVVTGGQTNAHDSSNSTEILMDTGWIAGNISVISFHFWTIHLDWDTKT